MRDVTRILLLLGSVALSAQEQVVRITVNLLQVDAVVVDRKGIPVTNLNADDFEILQDGKNQKISRFQFVQAETATKQPIQLLPQGPPKPGDVLRTIAIVVDDIGLAFEDMGQVHASLKKFVDVRIQPGDLVAIVRTSAGLGALQSFTTNRPLMYQAIDRVRWNSLSMVRSPFHFSAGDPRRTADDPDEFPEQIYSAGKLGAVNYVINGLRQLPGRKSVVLITSGIGFDPNRFAYRPLDTLQRLMDLANRASVVIYTADPIGLNAIGPGGMIGRGGFQNHEGLKYLAEETGGLFLNDNRVAVSLSKVLDDQKGYYLLGYAPSEATFDWKLHSIKVQVKRSGLKVRTRSGFIGVPDSEAKEVLRTREDQLMSAITSPFNSGEVPVRLTALFSNNSARGSFLSGLLHIDINALTFNDEADGWKVAKMDVLTMTFGDNGIPADTSDKSFLIRLRRESFAKALRDGFVYTIDLPVTKPGGYQLRCVVRDSESGMVGSASQFVEVPDVSRGKLLLSGLFLNLLAPDKGSQSVIERLLDDPYANPTLRTFQQGHDLAYMFQVLNAKRSPEGKEDLEMQIRIYREGKLRYEGKPVQAVALTQEDRRYILTGGHLRLGTDLESGDYVLEVQITDVLSKPKQNIASQYIDFEMTPAAPVIPPSR